MTTYRRRLSRAYRYGVEEAGRDLPLHETRGHRALADIVSYHKGALLLELLRWRLGNEVFFEGLSRYVRVHRRRLATLPALVAAMSHESGDDLRPLFRSWNLGYPTFRIGVTRSGDRTRVSVRADRLAHVSLPLVLHLAGGRRVLHRLPINARSATVLHRGKRVVAVSLDPAHRIPRVVRGALEGDVVIDGEVDARDVLAVGRSLDRGRGADLFDERADVVRDGRIDHRDVSAVLSQLGRSAKGRWYRQRLCRWLAPGLPGCPR